MRISSVKTAGKIVGQAYDFGGFALKGVITAGVLAIAIVSQGTLVPQGEVSPIEQFLLENGVEKQTSPKKIKPAKKQQKPVVIRPVKAINLKVAIACHKYDRLLKRHFLAQEFLLRKAQMHKESSCNARAVGGVGEIGLFQLKQSTCDDRKVTGDLFDPETNIRCAAAQSRWLCEVKGHCEIVPNLVAYNVGGDGVKRVRNLAMHPYAHGIFKILGLRA
jgi:hypothetical protein